MENELKQAREWLDGADSVLVTAGAGLSAAAGIDYTDRELFREHFPAMLQYGFTCQAQHMGFTRWDAALQWGYWAAHVDLVRHRWPRSRVYDQLAQLVEARDSFVLTSNVDAMFTRHGVAREKVHTPQGDYALLQCTKPCHQAVWDWKESLDAIRAATDPETQRVTDPEVIPRCPRCGETVFPNVRVDRSFVEVAYEETGRALRRWLATREGSGVVIELGAGFNTPTVVRFPSERLVAARDDWKLLRINKGEAAVPTSLGARALGFDGDATRIVASLLN